LSGSRSNRKKPPILRKRPFLTVRPGNSPGYLPMASVPLSKRQARSAFSSLVVPEPQGRSSYDHN
jgi:hypothetical protein